MKHATKNPLLAAVLTTALYAGAAFGAAVEAPGLPPTGAASAESATDGRAQQTQATRFGPYATARRAQEVANYYINQGYNAQWFHNGDGYYVDVW
jgi:hypothetical protein